MKRIVITGSNGLLGQSLVNLLLKYKNDYQVIGFSKGANRSGREDFDYISIDITNEENLKTQNFEIRVSTFTGMGTPPLKNSISIYCKSLSNRMQAQLV